MVDRPGFRPLLFCWLILIAGQVALADEPLASRRQRIENLDPLVKEQLLQRHEQFQAFDAEERDRLRNLHRDVENDPERAELRRVLDRYYDWLKTLNSYQLMELRKLPPEERIERIRTFQQEKELRGRGRGRIGFGRLGPGLDRFAKMAQQISPPDRKVLLEWTAEYAARHEDSFTQSLPDSIQRGLRRELGRIDDPADGMQVLFWRIWLRRQLDSPDDPLPDLDDDWRGLLTTLSPNMREPLEDLPEDEQLARIAGKIRVLALEHYFTNRSDSRPSVISDEELGDFFSKGSVQGRGSRLLGLPPAEQRREVWKFYLASKLLGMPQGFAPMGAGGTRRPGPQRHGPAPRTDGMRPDFGRPGGPPPASRKGPEHPPSELPDRRNPT